MNMKNKSVAERCEEMKELQLKKKTQESVDRTTSSTPSYKKRSRALPAY